MLCVVMVYGVMCISSYISFRASSSDRDVDNATAHSKRHQQITKLLSATYSKSTNVASGSLARAEPRGNPMRGGPIFTLLVFRNLQI